MTSQFQAGSGSGDIGLRVKMRTKISLDRMAVGRLLVSRRSPLNKSGAYVRKVAQNSMKTSRTLKRSGKLSETPSKAGKPPRARAKNKPLKRLISFSRPIGAGRFNKEGRGPYNLIGPRYYGGSKSPYSRQHPTSELHEKGGSALRKVRVSDRAYSRKKKKKGRRRRGKREREEIIRWLGGRRESGNRYNPFSRQKIASQFTLKVAHFEKRPYMVPALMKGKQKITRFFRESLRG